MDDVMTSEKKSILIACLVSTIFLIELEAMVLAVFVQAVHVYMPEAPIAIIGALYSVLVNYKSLRYITIPYFQDKTKSSWLKAGIIAVHALSLFMLLLSLLFLPLASSKSSDY